MKDYEICYYNDRNVNNGENHMHPHYEVYFFPEENASIVIQNQFYKLWKNDVVVLPPGILHRVIMHEQSEIYRYFSFGISKEYYDRLLQLSKDYNYIIESVEKGKQYIYHNTQVEFCSIQSQILYLLEEIYGNQYGKETKIFIGICDLMLLLNRMAYKQNNPQKRKEDQNLYSDILEYINDNLNKELSLEYLAGEFLVSKYHIAHIFKKNIGISIHQYIMKKRLTACKKAILSNLSISKSYLMFGFKDYSSFYRAFKKEFGISPKEYKDVCTQLESYKEV